MALRAEVVAPISSWAPLFVGVICSVPINYLLAEAVKRLPAATVYATFVGIGTAGTAIVGMLFFAESTSIGRVCLCCSSLSAFWD